MNAKRTIMTWLVMPALSSAFALLLAASPVAAKSAGQTQSSPTSGKVTSGGRGVTIYNWKTPTKPTPTPVTKQASQPTSSSTKVAPKVVQKPPCCTKKCTTKKSTKQTQPKTTQVSQTPKSSQPFDVQQFLKDHISKPIEDAFTAPWMKK
jgi:hypothetical protein